MRRKWSRRQLAMMVRLWREQKVVEQLLLLVMEMVAREREENRSQWMVICTVRMTRAWTGIEGEMEMREALVAEGLRMTLS